MAHPNIIIVMPFLKSCFLLVLNTFLILCSFTCFVSVAHVLCLLLEFLSTVPKLQIVFILWLLRLKSCCVVTLLALIVTRLVLMITRHVPVIALLTCANCRTVDLPGMAWRVRHQFSNTLSCVLWVLTVLYHTWERCQLLASFLGQVPAPSVIHERDANSWHCLWVMREMPIPGIVHERGYGISSTSYWRCLFVLIFSLFFLCSCACVCV